MLAPLLERLDRRESAWCLRLNRVARWNPARRLFALVSRIGDGVFWYVLMALLPLQLGRPGLVLATQMALTGLVGVLIYRWLKLGTERERPCTTHAGIDLAGVPLDRFSFPSGHTLHAVAFTLLVCTQLPGLTWLLAPFTLLVALSRVILGLHYPSDVLAGALLGAALASASQGVMRLSGI
jgi:undecaprenyl-diphosphatase